MLLDYFSGGSGGNATVVLVIAKATLILVGAVATAVLMKRTSAGVRHLVWVGALAALLVLPGIATIAPLRLAILPPVATAPSPSRAMAGTPFEPIAETPREGKGSKHDARASDVAPVPTGPVDAAAGEPVSAWQALGRLEVLAIGWGVIALAILGVLAHSAHAVRRIVRRGVPLQRQEWVDALYEIADRLDLEDAPRLVKSDDVQMPFACGFRSPTIVLPADCERWSVERRHAVLLHELAHVQRRDLLWHTVARITCAVYWFHPLVWTAAKRLRAESELACDDVALALGARATDYAEHLLDIVSAVRGERTPAIALAMARRKEFEGRMLAILDPDVPRARPGRLQSLALVTTIAMVVVLVGAAAPVQRTGSPDAGTTMLAMSLAGDGAEFPNQAGGADTGFAAVSSFEEDEERPDELGAESAATARATAHADADTDPGKWKSDPEMWMPGADDDERAILLARVLTSDTSASVRRIAAWGLAEHADEALAVNALANAVHGDLDASVREMAAWALGDSRGGSAAETALMQALRDRDVRVRATAAWALGSIGAREAVPALISALRDADAGVRTRAVWALGNADLERAPAELVATLESPDRDVRMLTAWALYEIEDPAAVPALSAALRGERDTELQVAYIRALASVGEESVDALRDLLDSSDPRVKRVAVQALAGGDAAGPWPWPWPEPRPFP